MIRAILDLLKKIHALVFFWLDQHPPEVQRDPEKENLVKQVALLSQKLAAQSALNEPDPSRPPAESGLVEPHGKPAVDLRDRLLLDLHNVELRQKYLAVRTPACTQADLWRAKECLSAARLVRLILGLTVLGTVGGAVGGWLLAPANQAAGRGALPILVGLGSAVSGAIGFALLAAIGHVVFPEIVGEVSTCRADEQTFIGRIWVRMLDTLCGGFWGAVCGLLIGPAVWVTNALIGLPGNGLREQLVAGAAGGVLAGVAFAVLVAGLGRRGAHATALSWAELGPLPVHAYLFSVPRARRHYLRKWTELHWAK